MTSTITQRTYGVYVIEIDGDPMSVYIGQTSKEELAERLAQHNAGGALAARVFRNGAHGTLRPDLYEHLPRFATAQESKRAERRLANQLRGRGFSAHFG